MARTGEGFVTIIDVADGPDKMVAAANVNNWNTYVALTAGGALQVKLDRTNKRLYFKAVSAEVGEVLSAVVEIEILGAKAVAWTSLSFEAPSENLADMSGGDIVFSEQVKAWGDNGAVITTDVSGINVDEGYLTLDTLDLTMGVRLRVRSYSSQVGKRRITLGDRVVAFQEDCVASFYFTPADGSDYDVLTMVNAPAEAGATVGATWGSNLSGKPLVFGGSNLCNPRYSTFEEAVTPPATYDGGCGTVSRDEAVGFFGSASLKLAATAADHWCLLGSTGTDFNIKVTPGYKWILSCWVRSNLPSATGELMFKSSMAGGTLYPVTGRTFTTSATAYTWTRIHKILDLTADTAAQGLVRIDNDGGAGCNMHFDGFMLEPLIGDQTEPSPYAPPGFFPSYAAYGADVTGENTAADVITVGGVTAAVVRDNAASAKSAVDNMSADGVFSVQEKAAWRLQWPGMLKNHDNILVQATSYGIQGESVFTGFTSAKDTLYAYLNTTHAVWAETPADSSITGDLLQVNTTAFYDKMTLAVNRLTQYTLYADVVGGPPADADKTSSNTAAAIAGQGAFATLNQINSGNASTFIAAAAIGNAQIGNAAIGAAHINTAVVDTLHLVDNAVTLHVYAYTASMASVYGTAYTTIQSCAITVENNQPVLGWSSLEVTGGDAELYFPTYAIYRNAVLIQEFPNPGTPFTCNFGDTPGDGSHTYYLKGKMSGNETTEVSHRRLSLVLGKK